MDGNINVAIVGCGYWGPNLVRNFRSLPGCRMRMICDTEIGRLAHMKEVYPGVETTQNFGDVVNNPEIEAVVIATPVRFHFDMGLRSLEAGKHTFIEKPIAASVSESLELNAVAEKRSLTLMVGHTFIYSPPVRKIREIIRSGDLGDILYVGSRRLNLGLFQKDINVAWDLAPHDISIILFVLDQIPVSVNCQGKDHFTKGIEDVTNMTLRLSNGAFSTIQSSWLDPNKIREMTFVGSKKMLVYDDLEPIEKIKIYDKRVEIPPHYDTFAEFHYAYHYGDIYSPYLKQIEPLKMECQHFLDCIKTGEEPESSGIKGLHVVQVLEAASESLKNGGREVEVKNLGKDQ